MDYPIIIYGPVFPQTLNTMTGEHQDQCAENRITRDRRRDTERERERERKKDIEKEKTNIMDYP